MRYYLHQHDESIGYKHSNGEIALCLSRLEFDVVGTDFLY